MYEQTRVLDIDNTPGIIITPTNPAFLLVYFLFFFLHNMLDQVPQKTEMQMPDFRPTLGPCRCVAEVSARPP